MCVLITQQRREKYYLQIRKNLLKDKDTKIIVIWNLQSPGSHQRRYKFPENSLGTELCNKEHNIRIPCHQSAAEPGNHLAALGNLYVSVICYILHSHFVVTL